MVIREGTQMQIVIRVPYQKYVREGEIMPRGYGLAWREVNRPVFVCLPIPLNLVARWAREFWFAIWSTLAYRGLSARESRELDAWHRGRRSGWEAGLGAGKKEGQTEGWASGYQEGWLKGQETLIAELKAGIRGQLNGGNGASRHGG
jgi:hypothetical protein